MDFSSVLKYVKIHPFAKCPTRATFQSCGYDLYSCETTIIEPWAIKPINTGITLDFPEGTYGRITGRSGNTIFKKIIVINGCTDKDFRGEIKVMLFNANSEDKIIMKGDKIAQIVIEKHKLPILMESSILNNSDRGENGFGSSGDI